MKLIETVGATGRIWQIFIADSSSLVGAGLPGLAFNTASLTAAYHRDTDTTATVMALVTMTIGTYTSLGFKEIDATNMPGWYQFCPPSGLSAAGAKSAAVHFKGAANMAPLPIEVQLVSFDLQSASAAQTGDSYARLGAPAGASHAVDTAAIKTDTAAVKVQTDKLTFSVTNQVDSNVLDWKSALAPAMSGDAFARLGAPAGASHAADVAAVKTDTAAISSKTANLPSDPADASDIATAFATANAAIAALNNLSSTQAQSAAAAALVAYATAKSTDIPAAAAIAAAVQTSAAASPLPVDTKKMNGTTVHGTGTSGDKWRGT